MNKNIMFADNMVKIIEPERNAVIVNFIKHANGSFEKIISIECVDEEVYPVLKSYAEECLIK